MVNVRVQLLDNTDYDVDVDKKAIGAELLEKVCQKLNLAERDYFGFTYVYNHIKFWINNEKEIGKQIKKGPWIVAFELKFYPDPTALHEEITRYQACLQVRRDILSGRLPCSFITLALLSSYAVQSQLGDYSPEDHGVGYEYLKNMEFSPTQNDELLEKVAELHRTHIGQSASEAELYYLDNAKNLALYGVHMHEAKDSDDEDVSIGVCAAGLLIYKDRIRVHRYTWPKIMKIRYKRNNFHIDIRPDPPERKNSVNSYKLSNVKMAKRLWRIAVEHHAFFRLREPLEASRSKLSRTTPYRYSGRTLYQTQRAAAQMERGNQEFSRGNAVPFTGSRSMDNLALGYSTERWEKTVADDQRTATLDLRQQRAGGSMDNLHGYQFDPNLEGQVNLLVGDAGRATYRPPGGASSQGFRHSGSQGYDMSAGYGQPHYANSQDGASVVSQDRSARPSSTSGRYAPAPQWNGMVGSRAESVTSEESTLRSDRERVQRPPRRKRNSSRSSQASSQADDRVSAHGYPHREDAGYTTIAEAGGNNWRPHSTGSLSKTKTRTYTASDGTIITEYRTERNGVVETHIEKRTRIPSVPEEDVDYDKELMAAINAVTNMNPDLSVQKIEIHTKSEEV